MLEKVPWKIVGEFSCNGITNVHKKKKIQRRHAEAK
jgi:hypothetical protein